jgi:aspartyl-tRNA(Asn)/glutamyl-tRNA(Gln) amidotransferase subunit B
VIGLEIHAELETASKMFCACPVVDVTVAPPNSAVCPVCAGMPGVLPVINHRAVEYALRVALALDCEIYNTSIFARKNYFYPDLPKGYQISQYEEPLARHGQLRIRTSTGERDIRIRRVHIEEDTGKSTHVQDGDEAYSLVDLNRSGVPLLEIVTEPDLHTPEEVRAYAQGLRTVLQYVGVNSGDMQKGVLRIEPNISVRPVGREMLGTRTEVKNLNSFRALERAVAYEIDRQIELIEGGGKVVQETVGWDESAQATFSQRSKEEAHDYRYFPEPDLPPLHVDDVWIEQVRADLPEMPEAKFTRFITEYDLSPYDADVLIQEKSVADYFEALLAASAVAPKKAVNWVTGQLFGLMNEHAQAIDQVRVTPDALGALIQRVEAGEINHNTGKKVLAEMFPSGKSAEVIIEEKGLRQVSDDAAILPWVEAVLAENPAQVETYLQGKESVARWLFGQVMRKAKGRANPAVVQKALDEALATLKNDA